MREKDKIELNTMIKMIDSATKRVKADFVIKNANILNVFSEKFEVNDLAISCGYIVGIGKYDGIVEIDATDKYIVPSFIDSHIHLESTIVSPANFRDAVISHGTCAIICDPHEIANVAGLEGVNFILDTTENLDLDVFVMVPSCVPATKFDESGAMLLADDIVKLYGNDRILGLAEFMNFYGVINVDKECILKCIKTLNRGLLIDGHAPNISDKNLNAYCCCNISTDHECSNLDEAIEKIRLGQYIEIREGTACHNLKELVSLINETYYQRCLFATDDKHPADLINLGHIDYIIKLAIQLGANPIRCFKIASYNAAKHYDLKRVGAIAPSYKANFVILNDIDSVSIDSCYINGVKVSNNNAVIKKYADNEKINISQYPLVYNSFNLKELTKNDFMFNILKEDNYKARVIKLVSGGVLTESFICDFNVNNNEQGIDLDKDIVKLAVVERHKGTGHIGLSLLNGYGIKKGAVASSVAHDSHNIIVVGTNANDMAIAANDIRKNKGGIAIANDGQIIKDIVFEIAGLMTSQDIKYVSKTMEEIKNICYNEFGVNRDFDPFMTLAFISLSVIPSLKLTTLGLVDVNKQELVSSIFI